MLRLRLCEGIDVFDLAMRFGTDLSKFLNKANLYQKHGLITNNNGIISLTAKGFLLSNEIITELLCCI